MRTFALLAALLAVSAGATTYPVGPTRAHPTLASLPALQSGDVIEIDPGTYHEVRRWTVAGVTVRGVGATTPVFDATGLTVDGVLPSPRAVFQVEAGDVTIENVELVNATNGDNGSGVRVTGTSANNVVLRNVKVHDNDMGIMSDGADNLLVDACEVYRNGTALYDGYSHNFYLGGQSSTVQFSYIHDSTHGQNFKSRGHFTALLYNLIVDSQDGEVGLVDATETAMADSNAVMIGNVIVSKPRLSGYNSTRFIQFGQDLGGDHLGTLFAFNNTFVAGDSRIVFLQSNATSSAIVASNNIFYGSDAILGGGSLSGAHDAVPAQATVPAGFSSTITLASSPFVDAAARDFHLTATSPARNAGVGGLSYLDGSGAMRAGTPLYEYVPQRMHTARASDSQLDVGAYEYGSSVDAGAGGGSGTGGGAAGGAGGTGGGAAGGAGGAGGSGGAGTAQGGGAAAAAGGGSSGAAGGAGGGAVSGGSCGCTTESAAPLLLALGALWRRSRSSTKARFAARRVE